MNFNLVKKHNKKSILWSGTTSFSFLVVGLVILFSLTMIDIKVRVMVAIQLVVNNLFIWLLLVIVNFSPIMIARLFQIERYRNSQTQKIEKAKFTLNNFFYLITILICFVIWISEISSFTTQTKDWVVAFKNYWWSCLIFLIFNFSFLSLFFNLQIYLYNNDKNLLKELKEF